eukprot:12516978-Prorocentrum_lima.AAC.1
MAWKDATPCLVDEMLQLLQQCCLDGCTPVDWQGGRSVHLKKKPTAATTSEHRGLTLLNHDSKIVSRVVHMALQP